MKIETLEHLKAMSRKGSMFYVLLNYGLVSRKYIRWDAKAKMFHVKNHIDNTSQHLTEVQIMDTCFTNIGKAIKKGALFMEEGTEYQTQPVDQDELQQKDETNKPWVDAWKKKAGSEKDKS